MYEWEFFEEGDSIGVQRRCSDGLTIIGCYTDAYREAFRCFAKDANPDEASFYIESKPCDNPHDAYYDMDLKMPTSLVEYSDSFFSHHDSDEYAMVCALRENKLWE